MRIYTHSNLPVSLLAEHEGCWYMLGGTTQTAWADRTRLPAPPLPGTYSPAPTIEHPGSAYRALSDIPWDA